MGIIKFSLKKNVGHCSPQNLNELKEGEARMTRARQRGTERKNKNMKSFQKETLKHIEMEIYRNTFRGIKDKILLGR